MARMIVEFLGPSGVGKTTTVKSVLQKMPNTKWHSLRDFLATKHWRTPPSDFSKTESMLLELRLAHQLTAGLFPIDLLHNLFIEYHHVSFEVFNRHNLGNELYLADEHIFQLFIKEIEYLRLHDPAKVKSLLPGRAFVFLTRSTDATIQNIKTRRAAGEYRSFANTPETSHLEASVRWFTDKVPSLKSYFLANGTPFIQIDLEEGDAEDKIIAFLNNLENSHVSGSTKTNTATRRTPS